MRAERGGCSEHTPVGCMLVKSLVANLSEVLEQEVTSEETISLLNTVREEYNPEGKSVSPDLENDVYPVLRAAIREKLRP